MPVREIARAEWARLLSEMGGTDLLSDGWNDLLEGIGRSEAVRDDSDMVCRRILAIADKAAEEPSQDPRAPEQIVGYDDTGLPI